MRSWIIVCECTVCILIICVLTIQVFYWFILKLLEYWILYLSGLRNLWLWALLAKPREGASKHACLQPFTQRCHPLLRLHGFSDNQDAEAVWTAVHKSRDFFPPSALLHYPYHRAGLEDWAEGDHQGVEGDWGWIDPVWWLQVEWSSSRQWCHVTSRTGQCVFALTYKCNCFWRS